MEHPEHRHAHVMAVVKDIFTFRLAEMVKNAIDIPVRPFSPGKKMHLMRSSEHLGKVGDSRS
jgi:hypothetical protein